MSVITEQYASAPEVFAWKPADITLPALLSFVPSVLVAFAQQAGATIYPWYHDLPIWQLRRTVHGEEQTFRGIQVGFGGMDDWPLPGSEGVDGTRLTLAGWVEPREEPGALATHILRSSAISPETFRTSLWQIWHTIRKTAVMPPRLVGRSARGGDEIQKLALVALKGALAERAAGLAVDEVVRWFQKAGESIGTDLSGRRVRTLAGQILTERVTDSDEDVTKRSAARWFEIPEEEFAFTPPEQLEPEVLIRHIYLERQFAQWLRQWGGTVSIGEDLEGPLGVDFTPDVYARFETSKGTSEVAISLICDDPPGINRVRALLEMAESYAAKASGFGEGDILVLATPFSFGKAASASIALQAAEEKYAVVKLEGEDLWDLQRAHDSDQRRREFDERVRRAKLPIAGR